MDDYEEFDNFYDKGERILMLILCALYFLCVVVSASQLLFILLHRQARFLTQNVIQICVLAVAVIRGLYFVLAESTSLFFNHDIVEFVFILIPTLIQMTLLVLEVLVWAIHALKLKIRFYIPFVSINIFFYLLFIILIILFLTLPTHKSDSCGGLAEITIDDTPKVATKTVFFVILMVVPAVLLVGLIVFGVRIYIIFKGMSKQTIRKIFFMAVLVSISVIVTTLYLLLITFLDIESVYLTFGILLGIELTPFAMLLWLLHPYPHNLYSGSGPTRRNTGPSQRSTNSNS